MTSRISRFFRIALALAAGAGCLMLDNDLSLDRPGSLLSQAEARVGRPLTPVSYAGVARRTTRRAVAVGATVGAATVYAPGCVQRVDAYGRVYYVCP